MSQSELKRPSPSCSTHSLFADEKTEASRSLQAAQAGTGGTGSTTISLLLLPALQFNPELGRDDLPTTPTPTPLPHTATQHTGTAIAEATQGLGRAVAGTYLQLS